MSRTDARSRFDHDTRLSLLESDADELHRMVGEISRDMKRHTQLLVGLLVSVTTACVLMVINVLALGGS